MPRATPGSPAHRLQPICMTSRHNPALANGSNAKKFRMQFGSSHALAASDGWHRILVFGDAGDVLEAALPIGEIKLRLNKQVPGAQPCSRSAELKRRQSVAQRAAWHAHEAGEWLAQVQYQEYGARRRKGENAEKHKRRYIELRE